MEDQAEYKTDTDSEETSGRQSALSDLLCPTPFYEDNHTTIYHGDCDQILPFLTETADLLLTDPPYGIGENSKKVASREQKAKCIDYGEFNWDEKTPAPYLVEMMRLKAKWQIIWGGNYFHLPPMRGWLVWDKDNTGDFADCELAWTNLPKAVRKIKFG